MTMERHLTPFEALKLAVEKAGSQAKLAHICDVSQTAVWKWLQSSKMLPGEHVLKVEAALGISRHLLNPKFYPLETAAHSAPLIGEETPLCGPILSARTLAKHGNRSANLDKPGKAA